MSQARLRVVFDFGGVLFRWQPARLLCERLAQHGVDSANAQAWVQRFFQGADGGDWADFDRGTLAVPELVQRIARRTALPESEVRGVVDAVAQHLAPVPETVALVRALHAAGVRLHYLSNMPAPYADHLERSHAVMRCFDGGVFSARVGLVKPEPAIFALAARQFGAAPGELLFLDDHLPNVQAAQAAGWQALHFSDAAACGPALQAAGLWGGSTPKEM